MASTASFSVLLAVVLCLLLLNETRLRIGGNLTVVSKFAADVFTKDEQG